MDSLSYDFFNTHLEPNYQDWLKDPTDKRLAMNAILSLYHIADHFWHEHQSIPETVYKTKCAGDYRKELASNNMSFRLLRDIAEAHKHLKLHRTIREISSAKQTDIGSMPYGEGSYSSGPYSGGPSLIVTDDKGKRHHLTQIARSVRLLWKEKLGIFKHD